MLYSPSEPYGVRRRFFLCWLLAASSALFLTVAGGVQALSTWLEHANVDHEMINLMGIQKLYMGLAWVAALVLIVPLFTLGASAAR